MQLHWLRHKKAISSNLMGKRKYGHLSNLVGFTNINNKKRKTAKVQCNEDKEAEDKDRLGRTLTS